MSVGSETKHAVDFITLISVKGPPRRTQLA